MKNLFNFIYFVIIFLLFKEVSYQSFELASLNESQVFVGEPKDLLFMQIGIFVYTAFLVFLANLIENDYKFFKNKLVNLFVVISFIMFLQIVSISVLFHLIVKNKIELFSEYYLMTLGISAVVLTVVVSALVFVKPLKKYINPDK